MTPDFFKQVFDLYWDAGFQVHVHNLGDGGLDILLDALEAAMQRNPRFDHRTVVVHFGYAQPDQIARIKRLGAIVSGNSVYTPTLADRYADGSVGRERTERMVPLGDAVRAGTGPKDCQARVACHVPLSDLSEDCRSAAPKNWHQRDSYSGSLAPSFSSSAI